MKKFVHLKHILIFLFDIAGMAFSKYGGALNSGGATGFGVRLLSQMIEDNYE